MSVDIDYQLPTQDSLQAVEDYGGALLVALTESAATMSVSDMHTFLHADREQRRALIDYLAERGVSA